MSAHGHDRERPAWRERNRQRFGLLLATIVTAFAIQGVAQPGRWEQVLVSLLLAATLLLALSAAEARPAVMRAALAICVAVVVLSVIEAANGTVDNAATRLASALVVLLAPAAIVVGVLRGVRATHSITMEAVLGTLCVYLLIGMFFASIFGAIDRIDGPFFVQGGPATVSRCLYFSFTTLATLGYGDYTARSNLGHTLSVFEALLGQLYLVTVVAVIVSNLGRGPVRERERR